LITFPFALLLPANPAFCLLRKDCCFLGPEGREITATPNMKDSVKAFLRRIGNIQGLLNGNTLYPPGHFYSPIVSVEEIKKRESEIWGGVRQDTIKGIDLNADNQLAFLGELAAYYDDIPFKETKQSGLRYYFENDYYSYTDGIVLFSLIRHLRPKRIMEVGSGFSSAVMLDVNNLYFANNIKLTFIEPFPKRLYSLISKEDKKTCTILEKPIQAVEVEFFRQLETGDILFIDSTHVSKTGSDVNYLLFEVLPSLKSGVLIHFHDIFYPFEYPKKWVLKGFSWNEAYLLKAFLMYNEAFEIKLFSQYLHQHHKQAFENMPLAYKNPGGNIWIEKK
jgi:predicted O-methyltransferase YrrM